MLPEVMPKRVARNCGHSDNGKENQGKRPTRQREEREHATRLAGASAKSAPASGAARVGIGRAIEHHARPYAGEQTTAQQEPPRRRRTATRWDAPGSSRAFGSTGSIGNVRGRSCHQGCAQGRPVDAPRPLAAAESRSPARRLRCGSTLAPMAVRASPSQAGLRTLGERERPASGEPRSRLPAPQLLLGQRLVRYGSTPAQMALRRDVEDVADIQWGCRVSRRGSRRQRRTGRGCARAPCAAGRGRAESRGRRWTRLPGDRLVPGVVQTPDLMWQFEMPTGPSEGSIRANGGAGVK